MTQPAPNPPPAAAPPPQPTIPMVQRDGTVVQVPHDQAAQAYASGQFGFVKGSAVPVVGSDGTIGHVDAEHAGDVLAGGGRLATPEEYRDAALDREYGGVGHTLAAVGEGAARGLSLGLSDPLAVAAGHLVGGDKGAEAVRQHLEGEKEDHPYGSVGGELIGAALPVLFTGGAAAPEEAAALGGAEALGATTEAGALAKVGQGLRTLGALPRGVTSLGAAAERAMAGRLGAEAGTVLGRAAQSAAKAAARGIVEGGLFGAGQGISESTLKDEDLTAEKLFASVGHGALMGGLLGAGLSGLGSMAVEGASGLLGKVAPKLDEAAGEQAWKWLDPLKRYSDEATKRAGGTDEVGRTVFERVLRPLVEERGFGGAMVSNDEKYELVQKALSDTGKQIGDLVAGRSEATVKLEDMLRPIQERIEEFSDRVGGEDKVRTLEKLRDSVTRVLGGGEEAEPLESKLSGLVPGSPEHEAALTGAGYVRRTPAELGEHLREHPELLEQAANGGLPLEATHKAPAVVAAEGAERAVPIADAIKQRRALQQLAFEESKSLDPNLRVQLLRDVSREWNGLEEEALNKAGKAAGEGLAGTQLRDLNREYQRLKIAADALESNTARYATNRNLSLTDYLAGAAHAPGMLLGGHPGAAVGALAMSVGHKTMRAHGNAYAALMLDRLAAFGGASKAASEFDQDVDRAIDAAISGKLARRMPRAFYTSGGESDAKRFEEEESRVRQLAAISPGLVGAHLQARTGPLATHLPNAAATMQQMAKSQTAYLASKLPEDNGQPASLTPQLAKPPVSAADRGKLLRAVDAVEGGPTAIMQRLATGKMTPEDVEVMQRFYPKAYEEIRQKIGTKCAERTKPLGYQERVRIGQLFDLPTDPTLTPQFRLSMQESYAKHPTAPSSSGPSPRKSAPASLGISKSLASVFDAPGGR